MKGYCHHTEATSLTYCRLISGLDQMLFQPHLINLRPSYPYYIIYRTINSLYTLLTLEMALMVFTICSTAVALPMKGAPVESTLLAHRAE